MSIAADHGVLLAVGSGVGNLWVCQAGAAGPPFAEPRASLSACFHKRF